jgi:hypothetical protein
MTACSRTRTQATHAAPVQGSCAEVTEGSRASVNFCQSDFRCANHDTRAACAAAPLTQGCQPLRPMTGGDCKIPANLLSNFESPTATASGVHYGPSAICVGVPNGHLGRPGASRFQLEEVCVATRCAQDGTLFLLFQDVSSTEVKEYECKARAFVDLGPNEGFLENVRLPPCGRTMPRICLRPGGHRRTHYACGWSPAHASRSRAHA